MHFKMLSATIIHFNLDQYRILLSGNGLILSFTKAFDKETSLHFFICERTDCMVFNTLIQCYFTYIEAASEPIHAFLEFFK